MLDRISSDEIPRATVKSQGTEVFMFGMLIGAFIGGGIGLLYAPMKGSDTRKVVKEKAQQAEETFIDLKQKVEKLSDVIAETVVEVKNQGNPY